VKVLVGETSSRRNVAILQEHGWGRMWVDKTPTPYPFEPWGLDNRAFIAWKRKEPWDEAAFLRRVEAADRVNSDPYLAVTPDIVAGGRASLEFSTSWRMSGKLPADWPWYLAVQDGMTEADVRPALHLFSGIFLGGSDRFKATAYRWRALAHSCQIKFHFGRAGTPAKLVSAFRAGADSCDSAFPLWTAERMKTFVWRWQGLDCQAPMEYGI
jgi:hypothetical protein